MRTQCMFVLYEVWFHRERPVSRLRDELSVGVVSVADLPVRHPASTARAKHTHTHT
jgi:hypothetical protein